MTLSDYIKQQISDNLNHQEILKNQTDGALQALHLRHQCLLRDLAKIETGEIPPAPPQEPPAVAT